MNLLTGNSYFGDANPGGPSDLRFDPLMSDQM